MPRATRTPYVLLGLLCSEPMTGYALKAAIDRTIGHFWRESYGQLYPTLRMLEQHGWVRSETKSEGGRARVLHTITPKGRAELQRWLREPPSPSPPRNELLLKVFFGRFAGSNVVEGFLTDTVRSASREVDSLLALAKGLEATASDAPELAYWLLTIDLGRRVAEARRAWAEQALRRLAEREA